MPKTQEPPRPAARASVNAPAGPVAEGYLAPPPPPDAKIIGVDCHPDSFTVAVLVGRTPFEARTVATRERLSLEQLLDWAEREFGPGDVFLLEAGANSFEVAHRLHLRNRSAYVLESGHVGRRAKVYRDNDRLAAVRIARVYLCGDAPAVWIPDERTRRYRELLHCYLQAVRDHTATGNTLKAFLNGVGLRLGSRNPAQKPTRAWLLRQRTWTGLDAQLLEDYLAQLDHSAARRRRFHALIAEQMSAEPLMLRNLKLLGIGLINAFALLAIIGDVHRFARPEQLVADVGLNPGRRQSGESKDIKVGIGQRGRKDLRHLLIQGAHAVLRMGKASKLGQWGWQLFARKGTRNVAVAAVARKMLVQVWHLLMGHVTLALETDRRFTLKLQKLCVLLGKERRQALGLGGRIVDAIDLLRARVLAHVPPPAPSAPPTPSHQPV